MNPSKFELRTPMPRGPQGQKRPADVIGNAVKVMRIATGEEEESYPSAALLPSWRGCTSMNGAGRAVGWIASSFEATIAELLPGFSVRGRDRRLLVVHCR